MRGLYYTVDLDPTLLWMWRCLAFVGVVSGVASAGEGISNKVLRYHSVGGGLYDNVPVEQFRRDIGYLSEQYDIVDLPDVLEPGDRKRIALTFDDGYRDFYYNVVPVLHEYEVPATVFVIADAVDDPEFNHNDRFEYEYMTRAELLSLVDDPFVTVGNHTATHPNLVETPTHRLEPEIVGAKQRLESMLGISVERFCYPFNRYDERATELVRETHELGVGAQGRCETIGPDTDPAVIPRVQGAVPFYNLLWNVSDMSTTIGSVGDHLLGVTDRS